MQNQPDPRKHTILITSPAGKGGVANFVKTLRQELQHHDQLNIIILYIGAAYQQSPIRKLFSLFIDLWRFWHLIRKSQPDLIHLNPSFQQKSIIRDGLFAKIAHHNKRPFIATFHGWNNSLSNKKIVQWLVKRTLLKAEAITALSSQFKQKLTNWGFSKTIEVGKVPYQLPYINEERDSTNLNIDTNFQLLFMARLIKEKGIYELLEAFKLLTKKYPNITLVIGGDGPEFYAIQEWIEVHELQHKITMKGYLESRSKEDLLAESQLFVLPTYHPEGLPISIIEALAYGLPVIVTPVGGIADVISDENGCILKSLNVNNITTCIDHLINHPERLSEMAKKTNI